jgi:hypothetical protein
MTGCESNSVLDPTWTFSNHLCTFLDRCHQESILLFPGFPQALLRRGHVRPQPRVGSAMLER